MTTYRDFFRTRGKETFSEYWNDFMTYLATDFALTTIEAGGGSATEAIGNLPHGVLVVTNDAADNDYDAFQTAESFKFVSGKKLQFGARFKLNEVVQSDLMIGLHIIDTNPFSTEPTDGIYFRKDDGDALLDFVVKKGGTASTLTGTAGVSALVADTWHSIEFYYDGGDSIDAFLDGQRIGSLPVTNAPDTEEIAVSFCVQNGEAVAKVLSMDLIFARQER